MKDESKSVTSKALGHALAHIHKLILAEEQVLDDSEKLKEFLGSLEVAFEDIEDHSSVEKLRHEIKNLKALVYKDELTGVLNRRGVMEEFEGFFKEALFAQEHTDVRKGMVINDFSILFFDLDNFKSINDTYGHAEGDRVLKELAHILRSCVRDIDAVGRLGGEEFVAGLLGAHEHEAYQKAETIRQMIEKKITVDGHPITASIGVASLKESGARTLHELISAGDKAMYEAKTNRGKNNTARYSELPQ